MNDQITIIEKKLSSLEATMGFLKEANDEQRIMTAKFFEVLLQHMKDEERDRKDLNESLNNKFADKKVVEDLVKWR